MYNLYFANEILNNFKLYAKEKKFPFKCGNGHKDNEEIDEINNDNFIHAFMYMEVNKVTIGCNFDYVNSHCYFNTSYIISGEYQHGEHLTIDSNYKIISPDGRINSEIYNNLKTNNEKLCMILDFFVEACRRRDQCHQ